MQKKENSKRSRRLVEIHRCIFCKISCKSSLTTFSNLLIGRQYYYPLEKFALIQNINNIVKGGSGTLLKLNYKQAALSSQKIERLLQYNIFNATAGKIKSVILQRTKRDKLFPMYFHGKIDKIINDFCHSKKRIACRPILRRLQKPTSGTNSTNQQPKPEVGRNHMQKHIIEVKNNGNQTTQMKKLTRTISNMVRRFDDQCDFHSSSIYDIIFQANGHNIDYTCTHKQQTFKKLLEDNNISEIKDKNEIERLVTSPEPFTKRYQENYGFNLKQKTLDDEYKCGVIQKRKYVSPNHLREMKENIPHRNQTDYDCEAIKKSKKKPSISSSKRDLDKGSKKLIGSTSRKKDLKISSTAKSRVK